VAMDAGDVEAGVPLRSCSQQHPRGLKAMCFISAELPHTAAPTVILVVVV
jgi:hypothetical protein